MFGGEIDIIAERDNVLAFIEVKSWDVYGYEELGRAVNRQKRNRIIRAARGFAGRRSEYDGHSIRFDVMFITGDRVEHTVDAYTETDAI